jgi:hypothetical protein
VEEKMNTAPASVSRPKILIVENLDETQVTYRKKLEPFVEIISASTIGEGRALFEEHPDVSAIVVDGRFTNDVGRSGSFKDTLDFVAFLHEYYPGPTITSASNSGDRVKMLNKGCTETCSDKSRIPSKIKSILGIEG